MKVARTQPLEAGAQRLHAETRSDPLFDFYEKQAGWCSGNRTELIPQCTTDGRYDAMCGEEINDFYAECVARANKCFNSGLTMRKDAKPYKRMPPDLMTIEECTPITHDPACKVKAKEVLFTRGKRCTDAMQQRMNRACPMDGLHQRCFNAVQKFYEDCYSMVDLCGNAVLNEDPCTESRSVSTFPECQTEYTFPPMDDSLASPGDEVILTVGKKYKIFSVTSCRWGGYHCDKAIVHNGTTLILGPASEALVFEVQAASAGQYYLVNAEGGAVSYDVNVTCPIIGSMGGAFNEACEQVKLGGPQAPFVIKQLMPGTDQFAITSNGWQLTTNEYATGTEQPQVLREWLLYKEVWRLEPVS